MPGSTWSSVYKRPTSLFNNNNSNSSNTNTNSSNNSSSNNNNNNVEHRSLISSRSSSSSLLQHLSSSLQDDPVLVDHSNLQNHRNDDIESAITPRMTNVGITSNNSESYEFETTTANTIASTTLTTSNANQYHLYHNITMAAPSSVSVSPLLGSTPVEGMHSITTATLTAPSPSSSSSSSSSSFVLLLDKIIVLLALLSWYIISILSIVTTKIILQNWYVPPLLLTIQQMILGHCLLRIFIIYIYSRDRTIQPLPWDAAATTSIPITTSLPSSINTNTTTTTVESISNNNNNNISIISNNTNNSNHISNVPILYHQEASPRSSDTSASIQTPMENSKISLYETQSSSSSLSSLLSFLPFHSKKTDLVRMDRARKRFVLLPPAPPVWYHYKYSNFIWCGICNAGDFVCSNIAFSCSSAHFVETIKASEPITTTTIALLWKVDKLSTMEGTSILFLICGVLLSTWGNSTAPTSSSSNDTNALALVAMAAAHHSSAMDEDKLMESIKTASLAICANISFGFRAIHQKRYRSTTHEQMDDVNFLCRMMQVGATFLFIPTVLLYLPMFCKALIYTPTEIQLTYLGLALVNAMAYVTYNLASCYVLSKLSVLHHSSLNCLRRMVAILATSIYFHKGLSLESIIGLFTSFTAFISFTYFRNQRVQNVKVKDSNV